MNIFTFILDTIVKYSIIIADFLMAIFAAHVIVTGGEFEDISSLVRLDDYPIAMLGSFVIAFVAVKQVRFSTLWVHKRFTSYDLRRVKISWQIGLCLLCPFVTISSLATLYYAFHGHFILDTMWLDLHGWAILMMLIVLNFVLAIPKLQALLPVVQKSETSPLVAQRQIVCVIHRGRVNFVYYTDGGYMIDARSLIAIFETLDSIEYIFNLRHSIFRKDNIKAAFNNNNGTATVEMLIPVGETTIVSGRLKAVLNGYYTD